MTCSLPGEGDVDGYAVVGVAGRVSVVRDERGVGLVVEEG